MKKWVPLVNQLLFGWDTTIGIGVFTLLSLLFREQPRWSVFALSILSAYLPDADLIPFLLLRRRLSIKVGHWVFGHYPVLVLSVEGLGLWLISSRYFGGNTSYIITLGLVCTVCHFIHDGTQAGGFHFLAPLTENRQIRFTFRDPMIWTHYRIHWGGIQKAAPQHTRGIYIKTVAWSQQDEAGHEILMRTEPVTKAQVMFFALSISSLLLLLASSFDTRIRPGQ